MSQAYGFVFPVLAGQEPVIDTMVGEWAKDPRAYSSSRSRAGITMERVWSQRNPLSWQKQCGVSLVNVYLETTGGIAQVINAFGSGSTFDNRYLELIRRATGIDFIAFAKGGTVSNVASWSELGKGRDVGVVFSAPLQTDIGDGVSAFREKFGAQMYGTRAAEMAQSRRTFGITNEEVFVQSSPGWSGGALMNIYIEGPQVGGMNLVASANTLDRSIVEFDQSFLAGLTSLVPAFVAINEPPAITQKWDSQAGALAKQI